MQINGRTFISVCLAIFLSCNVVHSASLTFVEQTRLIFNSDVSSVGFPIKNDTSLNYLVKASVKNVNKNGSVGNDNTDFIVLPEVFVLEKNKHQNIKVARISGSYPKDRESVFYLNGYFVPEADQNLHSPFNLAFSINVKMFYRPKNLIDFQAVKQVASQIKFELSPKGVLIKNPTPYYACFATLTVGNYSFSSQQLQTMVPPHDSRVFKISLKAGDDKNITWALIDEFGNPTENLSVKVKVE